MESPPLAPPGSTLDAREPGHSVELYEDDAVLVESLAGFIGSVLRSDGPALVIATEPHRRALAERLAEEGIDVDHVIRSGMYLAFDSAATLSSFTMYGQPDRKRFLEIASGLLSRAAEASSSSKGRPVAAFGEMVALLWADGNSRAALALERLWNEVVGSHALYLHCAYPSSLLAGPEDPGSLAAVAEQHHDVFMPGVPSVGIEQPSTRSLHGRGALRPRSHDEPAGRPSTHDQG